MSGVVLERGGFEPYPMIRRKFPDVKNKPGAILTSYGVLFWGVMPMYAAVVELVDTQVSKTCEGNFMSVRLRPAAIFLPG